MTPRPHIAIACLACGGEGSVGAVAVHHAVELSKYLRITLVSDSFPDTMPKEVNLDKVTPRRFDYLRRFCHVPNEYAFAKAVRKSIGALHENNPTDMLICHSHAVAALSAKPLKELFGIPYGLVTHGDIFDRPKGAYDSRLTAFYKWVTPKAYRHADLVLALSPYMASCAIKGGASPDTVKIVPNGIDPADIGLDDTGSIQCITEKAPNDPIKLLFVGRLSVEKGVNVLIEACEILNNRGVNFTLGIIGTGPLEGTIRRMIAAAHLRERITLLGRIERRSLGHYYRRADLVCVTSLSDPLPTVVLESLLSGVPVLGSNVGGIPYMIETDKNGVIVPHVDAPSIANVIDDLSQHREKLCSLADNAYISVYPRFQWEDVGRTIYCTVEEVLALNCRGVSQNKIRNVRQLH